MSRLRQPLMANSPSDSSQQSNIVGVADSKCPDSVTPLDDRCGDLVEQLMKASGE